MQSSESSSSPNKPAAQKPRQPLSARKLPQCQKPAASEAGLSALWVTLIWMLRLLVGGVFILSGFAKMADLWGFVFKIEEYLAVWDFVQPRSVVFIVAMLISGYEFVLGTLLAMGCYKRVAPAGLLLSMVVMLPLSLYLWVADPVSDCGCFGDMWKISNGTTFFKNLLITAALILLLIYNGRLRQSVFNPEIQWIVGAIISGYILIVGLYGYNAQPMVDFRPYPVGTAVSTGAEDDESEDDFLFVYERQGARREFAIDEIPEDTAWHFVERLPMPRQVSGSDIVRVPFPAVFDDEGEEVTSDVIHTEGEQWVIVIPEPKRADVSFTYTLNEIAEQADSLGIPCVALLGSDTRGLRLWQDLSMPSYPCYVADDTQLKELSRGTISLVILRDGVVASKTTISSMDASQLENPESSAAFRDELQGHGAQWFKWLTIATGALLLLIYLFQGIILVLRAKIRRAYRNKTSKKS